ncbi:MAG: TonB family protein [Terracidiphilus sp.]
MRRILVASLLLSPMLFTAAAFASPAMDDASASTQLLPISTGVKPAKIVHTTNIEFPSDTFSETIPNDTEVVLTMNVDEKGTPQNIQIVRSADKFLDARVLEAVSQFRFRPAMLDKKPIPTDMTLNVVVKR